MGFERVDEFWRSYQWFLGELQEGALSEEESEWMRLLDDPESNRRATEQVEALLGRCRQEWNDKTGSFCLVLPDTTARPKVRVDGRHVNATRLVFVISQHWPVSEVTQIRHLCDNGRCLNPDHLMHGTADTNYEDRMH